MLKKEFIKFYKNSKLDKYIRDKVFSYLFWLIKTKRYHLFLKTLVFLYPYLKFIFVNYLKTNSLVIFIIINFVIILLLSFI